MEVSAQDPRELLMWNHDITPNKQELSNYIARNKLPLGVYVPKGNVRVPSIRSKRIRQIEARSARTVSTTPHLLMVRPTTHINSNQSQSKKLCPNVYVTRSAKRSKLERPTQDEARQLYNLKYLKSSESRSIPNTQNKNYIRSTASSKALLENLNPLSFQVPQNVPRLNEGLLHASVNQPDLRKPQQRGQFCETKPNTTNNASFVPQSNSLSRREIQVRDYYDRLSKFAAMAWSDCSQATEKLRQLYEETTRLSQAYNAIGFIPYSIPATTGLMTPSPAIGVMPRTNEMYNTPLCSFNGDKISFGQNENPHSIYCTCSMCELTRAGSRLSSQQLQQGLYNPQAVSNMSFAKEPLHGIVVNQFAQNGSDGGKRYQKCLENQYKKCNNEATPCNGINSSSIRGHSSVKRRMADNDCYVSSKMARMDNKLQQNDNKAADKLADVASNYFRNGSIFGSILNVHNSLDKTPTIPGQYTLGNDLTHGSRRSEISLTSLSSFDDQRLPCVSSSPSDDLNAISTAAFGQHSYFPQNALGAIRTPVVNFNH